MGKCGGRLFLVVKRRVDGADMGGANTPSTARAVYDATDERSNRGRTRKKTASVGVPVQIATGPSSGLGNEMGSAEKQSNRWSKEHVKVGFQIPRRKSKRRIEAARPGAGGAPGEWWGKKKVKKTKKL